ncbi:hypothetical protein [Pelagibius marinus]|uniref:hypothetical protein n=1 Tax=Pelagibius marinus TaxID=2762760 RepID=UPI00187310FC|nr:hypothetical protein [Pelagibius marinus]
MKLAAALLTVLLLLLNRAAAAENAVVEVYFLPFEGGPREAVTTESIRTLGSHFEVPIFSFALSDLTSWIEQARRSGPFDDKSVRAWIAFPDGSEVAIDARGTIRREAGLFRNGKKTVDDLASIFERLRREVLAEQKLRKQWPWVIAAANAQIASNEGWPESDYGLWLASPWCRDQSPDELCVMVSHREDTEPYISDVPPEVLTAGGGKSTLLYFDKKTRQLVRQMWFQ